MFFSWESANREAKRHYLATGDSSATPVKKWYGWVVEGGGMPMPDINRQIAPAPWPDANGREIRRGDVIRHPDGKLGIVVLEHEQESPHDAWRVDYGDGVLSRLSLQINDKGQAVVVARGI